MSHASFANFIDAPASSPRSSRLAAASVIACSTLAAGLALAFTFERMAVLRMPGPKTRYELAAVVMAEPPKVVDPPAKPEEVAAGDSNVVAATTHRPDPVTADRDLFEGGESVPDGNDLAGPSHETGIPGFAGPACPGGICAKGPIGIPGGGGPCIGPNCSSKPVAKLAPPPEILPLSSLACLSCADPNEDELRRTAAGIRRTPGTNVTRFCVDATGRVEPESVVTDSSHGDAEMDRVCRKAVKGWRFSPMKVDGEGRRACSQATFRIRFE